MSTLKTTYIQHPSSTTPNLTLDASGAVTGGFPYGGRNRIINGGFDCWQRGTSFSSAGYTADRWSVVAASGQTISVSQQSFAAGNAIAGYEPTYYLRTAWSGSPVGYYWLTQKVEDVRTFAGQTVTLSFWAKASSSTNLLTPTIEQNFGSGGSAGIAVTGTAISLTTSWQRFTQTFSIPSISGKTIGTNSYLDVRPLYGGLSVNGINIDLWGVQLETGSAATPFEVEPYAETLRKCQRYFWRNGITDAYPTSNPTPSLGFGITATTTNSWIEFDFPTTMRVGPTASYGGTAPVITDSIAYNLAVSSISVQHNTTKRARVSFNHAATGTVRSPASFSCTAGNTAYVDFTAEF